MKIEVLAYVKTANDALAWIDGISLTPGQRVLLINTDPRPKWKQRLGAILWKLGCKRFYPPSQDGAYTVTKTSANWLSITRED